jgi:transposase
VAADLKKGADEHAHLVLADETGCLLAPLVRRSLAPRGQTPILLQPGGRRGRVSVAGALCLSPVRRRPRLFFQTFPKQTIDNDKAADFLHAMLRQVPGNVIVVWDGGPMHRGPAIRALLERFPRLTLETLPPYAPELNPVEFLWSHLKYTILANVVIDDVADLDAVVTDELTVLSADRTVLHNCCRGSPLRFTYPTLLL